MRTVDFNAWREDFVLEEEADLRRRFGVGTKVGGFESPQEKARREEMGGSPIRITMASLRDKMSEEEWRTAPELLIYFKMDGRLPGSSVANVTRGCAYALVQAGIAEMRYRPPGKGGGLPPAEFRLKKGAPSLPLPGNMTSKEAREFHRTFKPPVRRGGGASPANERKIMKTRGDTGTMKSVTGSVGMTTVNQALCLRLPIPRLMSVKDLDKIVDAVEAVRKGLGYIHEDTKFIELFVEVGE